MKRIHPPIIAWCMALTVTIPLTRPACATPSNSCEDALKECLVQMFEQRERCIASPITTSACARSPLEGIVNARISFSLTGGHEEGGPAFLGPTVVDKGCLLNFDNALAGALVKGSLSSETVTSLESSITSCAKRETPELTRP